MKPQAVDPGATSRAEAYALWMDAPNPMVTFFKTLDVTPLVRLSRRKGLKFNMLLCWCIGSAASRALPRAGAGEHTDTENIKLSLLISESAGIIFIDVWCLFPLAALLYQQYNACRRGYRYKSHTCPEGDIALIAGFRVSAGIPCRTRGRSRARSMARRGAVRGDCGRHGTCRRGRCGSGSSRRRG